MVDHCTGPVVRAAFEVVVDRLLVPADQGLGVVVLVEEPEGVAELVDDHAVEGALGGVEGGPAEVHGRLRRVDREHVRADIGPGALAGVEGDAEIGGFPLPGGDDVELDAVDEPVARGGQHPRMQGRRPAEEADPERGAFFPQFFPRGGARRQDLRGRELDPLAFFHVEGRADPVKVGFVGHSESPVVRRAWCAGMRPRRRPRTPGGLRRGDGPRGLRR